MEGVTHHYANVNGLRLHVAEQGEGPLVLLLHGWPECWYSWRRQFAPFAAAGYRVVALDQRGYARSDQPEDVSAYTLLHLAGDVVNLIRELGEEQAILVGHDFGAPVAWVTTMLRPDVVRGVAGLSVPPILPAGLFPPSISRAQYGEGFFHVRFQQPGVAEELTKDIASSIRRILFGLCGDNAANARPKPWVIPAGMSVLDTMPEPPSLPGWLTDEDIQAYAEEFSLHGDRAFTGPFHWYRNLERNVALLSAFQGRGIDVPALYVVGDRDLAVAMRAPTGTRTPLREVAPFLRAPVVLQGCGHWTQQERPAEVNAALLDFFADLDRTPAG
jgi:pimeloyl-ACP methyl ester carboxylesterase